VATVILVALVVVALVVVAYVAAALFITATAPTRTPERSVWCVVCGRELPVSEAVVVAEVPDDEDEREMVGGTVCIVEYCPEHAP